MNDDWVARMDQAGAATRTLAELFGSMMKHLEEAGFSRQEAFTLVYTWSEAFAYKTVDENVD